MSTSGNGAFARVVSATSGKEWFGEVLVFGPAGAVFLRDAETAEQRWFPASWVASVLKPTDYDAGPCTCRESDETGPQGEVFAETDRACPHHGDPETVASAILKKARPRA